MSGTDVVAHAVTELTLQFFAAHVPFAHGTWLGSVAQRRRVRRIIVELDQIR